MTSGIIELSFFLYHIWIFHSESAIQRLKMLQPNKRQIERQTIDARGRLLCLSYVFIKNLIAEERRGLFIIQISCTFIKNQGPNFLQWLQYRWTVEWLDSIDWRPRKDREVEQGATKLIRN